ncbi:microtubule-associated proteins 1A/1B light chain 3A [Dendroctonus ponderosae]|uniref:Uncharacterized protein n=1 Tax=Dendroctonus ponderosae TaxID=77166 RepID=A0AAR5PXQ8_DENPD|nr:microtubule-associated proteins 1A/1B light chain 3A [Dendroctonus ponderosae]
MNDERKFYVREVKMPILNFGGRDIKKEEIMAIKDRFPSKIPVIIHKYQKDHFLPVLDKSKFLIPGDMSMSHFQAILRKRLRMSNTQALYLLVNERTMMSLSLTIQEVYKEHAQPNGFLYITYAAQEAFGAREDSESKKETIQLLSAMNATSATLPLLK